MKTVSLLLLPIVFAVMPATAQETPKVTVAELPPLTAAEVSALYGEPTRVSLDVKEVPVDRVFTDLARQGGFELGRAETSGFIWGKPAVIPPVTLSFTDVPFWAAVDRVAKASGVSLKGFEMRGKGTYAKVFGLSPADTPLGLSQTQGLFEASLTRIGRRSTYTVSLGEPVGAGKAGKQERTHFDYDITFRSDPKLPLVPGSLGIQISSPLNKLQAAYSSMHADSGSFDRPSWSLSQTMSGNSFDGPAEGFPAKKPQHITAICGGLLWIKADVWNIDDLQKLPQKRVFGGQALTVTSVKVGEKKVDVEVKIDDEINPRGNRPSRSTLEWAQREIMLQTLMLIDSEGSMVMPKIRQMPQAIIYDNDLGLVLPQTDFRHDTLKFEYSLTANTKAPFKLQWKFPTEIRSFSVPFTWKDLPLP